MWMYWSTSIKLYFSFYNKLKGNDTATITLDYCFGESNPPLSAQWSLNESWNGFLIVEYTWSGLHLVECMSWT